MHTNYEQLYIHLTLIKVMHQRCVVDQISIVIHSTIFWRQIVIDPLYIHLQRVVDIDIRIDQVSYFGNTYVYYLIYPFQDSVDIVGYQIIPSQYNIPGWFLLLCNPVLFINCK